MKTPAASETDTLPAPRSFWREFWRRFVTLQGYRDHFYGLLFCGLMAYYTFVAYWRLRGMRNGRSDQVEDLL